MRFGNVANKKQEQANVTKVILDDLETKHVTG